jgi:hypothetical protein
VGLLAVIIPPMQNMLLPDFLDKWGMLIMQNPIAFFVFGFAIAVMTWKACQFVNAGQLETLKQRLQFTEEKLKGASFEKPSSKRTFSPKQCSKIATLLLHSGRDYIVDSSHKVPRIACIQIPSNADENEEMAYQLGKTIESVGWEAEFELRHPDVRYRYGIWVLGPRSQPGRDPTTRELLNRALEGSGIQTNDSEEEGFAYDHPELAIVVLGEID